ncbi:carbon-nitrogen hydrolase [Sordaria brevicollis]|uniref:Carbon-nitrogen hydrolase n=1 Tax=Sordaria brevicollis TaxID=83679 RepID=A0AAE0PMW3_SORBR|nr:carbon-nitrogen hydrolase [Sordaria brevicollis]
MRATTSRSLRILTSSLIASFTRPTSSTYHCRQPLSALPTTARLLLHSRIRKMASSTKHPILLKKPVKLACIQLASGADKAANLSHAADKVRDAASGGANIVVLPECFNSPYGCDFFPSYAEQLLPSPPPAEQSPSFHALSAMARDNGIYLVGGSIPELAIEEGTKDTKTYYNTSLVFGPDGKLLASHRKVHLFDIDIPGKIKFKESDVLSPGNSVTLVDLPDYGRIAVAICYDIRFPELAMIAARKDCFALVYPGAFNTTTGPLHWRLQGQARAMDNQIYVALCSPARDTSAGYHAYGHSLIVDPMAQVLVEAEESEAIVSAELDGQKIEEARSGIPLRDQRRFDIYPDVSQAKVRLYRRVIVSRIPFPCADAAILNRGPKALGSSPTYLDCSPAHSWKLVLCSSGHADSAP